MARYTIVDTFPAFLRVWESLQGASTDDFLIAWAQDYLGSWPDLYRKQVRNYSEAGVDWKRVARRRIFPTLGSRIRRMAAVRRRLLEAIPIAYNRCQAAFGVDFPITFVIHVGIGCGAGWATRFRGTPAVLFGVENAAETDWTDPVTVTALAEHEIAHLLHGNWRRRAGRRGVESQSGAWWQLYTEGFATACEMELGTIGKHHTVGCQREWVAWCREHRTRLARLFLRSVGHPTRIRRFFGSWYPLDGHIETGYFLGREVIEEWRGTATLPAIAQWDYPKVRRRARQALQGMTTS